MAVYYDPAVYALANVTSILALVVASLSLFVFVFGIFAGKLVGV